MLRNPVVHDNLGGQYPPEWHANKRRNRCSLSIFKPGIGGSVYSGIPTINCIRKIISNKKQSESYIDDNLHSIGEEVLNMSDEYQDVLNRAVAQLPPSQQKVLYYLQQGLKTREIAEQMGISTDSVKKYRQWAASSVAKFIKAYTALGYPLYLLSILGAWKLLGVVAILVPRFPLVKEWAYAGFFFAMSGAFVSHLVVRQAFAEAVPSLTLLVFTVLSWYFRPAERKVTAAHKHKSDEGRHS